MSALLCQLIGHEAPFADEDQTRCRRPGCGTRLPGVPDTEMQYRLVFRNGQRSEVLNAWGSVLVRVWIHRRSANRVAAVESSRGPQRYWRVVRSKADYVLTLPEASRRA